MGWTKSNDAGDFWDMGDDGPAAPRFCPKCKKPVTDDSAWCPECRAVHDALPEVQQFNARVKAENAAFAALEPCREDDSRSVPDPYHDGDRVLVRRLVAASLDLGGPTPRYTADGKGIVLGSGCPVLTFMGQGDNDEQPN